MEPVFVNKYIHTKDLFIEMNHKYNELQIILLGSLFFVLFIGLSLLGYFCLDNIPYSVATAILGIIFTFYPYFRIKIIAAKREKQYLELFGTIPESETLFFDDRIESVSRTTNAELKLEYEKIKKIKQSKNMYLLILSKSLVVMVNKNGFIKGDCEDFADFIKGKAINAKIKL